MNDPRAPQHSTGTRAPAVFGGRLPPGRLTLEPVIDALLADGLLTPADADRVRALFTRMLPILNVQAVFRWSLTKYVLKKRGLIAETRQRMPGPLLDEMDRADVDAFLLDIDDLLLPQDQLP